MELRSYLSVFARRWYIIVLITIAFVFGAAYASRLIPSQYQAESSLRVVTPLGGSVGDVSYQTTYAIRLMNTYAELAASSQILNEVKQKLNYTERPNITVKIVPDSEIIQITVVASKPKLAADIANGLAEAIIAKSQADPNVDSENSAGLAILTNRQKAIQAELDNSKANYQKLVTAYSETTAKLAVMNMSIGKKEDFYQSLQTQYQQAIVSEAIALYTSQKNQFKTTQNILLDKLDNLASELATMRQQYQDLSESSAEYSQQLVTVNQEIQSQQKAMQDLQSQYDAAQIANSKHESAQNVMIASPATVPTRPSGISNNMILGLGLLGGLIVGVVLALLADSLDTRFHNTDQLRQEIDAPVLGHIAMLPRKDRDNPLESKDPTIQKVFWSISTKVLAMLKEKPIRTILVTSPNPAEGKSTLIVGIAAGLARASKKVLVVDADLRKSRLSKLFHVPNERGLSDILSGDSRLEEVVQVLAKPAIHFLPAGPVPDDPAALVYSKEFAVLLDAVSKYDVVLFDSPALLAVPDATNLAMQVDGILLVVQRNHTTVNDIRAVLHQLEEFHSKLLGTVVNKVPMKRISGYYQQKSWRLPLFSGQQRASTKPGTVKNQQAAMSSMGDKN